MSTKSAGSSRQPEGTSADTRPAILDEEKLGLWVRSGGRCAYCNKYLLDDEWFVYDVSTGEMAHIVGWKQSSRSPRGSHPLPVDERNKASNLMLLCAEHHQLIDKKKLEGDFDVARLQREKKEHEDRIYHLTGLGRDRETVVIRMVGNVRGAAAGLSAEEVREVVFAQEGCYPRFPLVYDRQGVEIDLSSLPDPETTWDGYWLIGQQLIDRELARVAEGIQQGGVRRISAFALARIPLLLYLGYRLDDKIRTSIYQKHRGGGEGWSWPTDAATTEFQSRLVREGTDPAHVALLLSVSGSVSTEELPAHIDDSFSVLEIRPTEAVPHRDVLRSKSDLDAFSRCYHAALSGLETTNKQARTIHLFAATPVSASVACGRGIMRDAQPALAVYDRSEGGYRLALTVNAR